MGLTPTARKEITYNRHDHDYAAYLNDEYIGSFKSHLAAETELDRLAYEQLARAKAVQS